MVGHACQSGMIWCCGRAFAEFARGFGLVRRPFHSDWQCGASLGRRPGIEKAIFLELSVSCFLNHSARSRALFVVPGEAEAVDDGQFSQWMTVRRPWLNNHRGPIRRRDVELTRAPIADEHSSVRNYST